MKQLTAVAGAAVQRTPRQMDRNQCSVEAHDSVSDPPLLTFECEEATGKNERKEKGGREQSRDRHRDTGSRDRSVWYVVLPYLKAAVESRKAERKRGVV